MFFNGNFQPFHTLQELNLDWILTKIKGMLRFLPDDGVSGQILRRTPDGAEWSDETTGGNVDSVNGKTGVVVLDKSDIGLGNVDNVRQYSAGNPPPYPVTSVNAKTGDVVLDASDVGLGSVDNVRQYSASNPPPYPVTAVNSRTGNLVSWLPYYTCSTGAAMVNKYATAEDDLPNFAVKAGTSIIVYFSDTNSASNPTLSLSNDTTGSQFPIMQYGTTAAGTAAATTAWNAASPVLLTCNGTAWIMNKGYNTNTTYTVTDVLCTTSASTAAKTASGTYFSLTGSENKLFEITFRYTNTKAAKITLNIASTGVKDVWLDGAVTSASNYSIRAGHYLCLYDVTNDCYQLYSNGRIKTDIIGTASGNYSATNPPPYPVTSVNGQTGDIVTPTTSLVIEDVWLNTNGTGTAFPATTLSLDLSAYDYYMVYCAYNTSTPRLSGGQWFPVDDGEYQITASRLNNNYNSSRSFQYNTLLKQLTISVGVYNGSNDTGSMIPYFIKGVKL